ncbi:MAG: transcriptional regulator [Pseudomonadota bacterium]
MSEQAGASARYDYAGLDRVIHEKARLGVMTSLYSAADGLAFGDLKSLCALTDGNLSRHLATLETAGLVTMEKGYRGRRPHTQVLLTPEGRSQFEAYVAELERVVKDAARAKPSRSGARRGHPKPSGSGSRLKPA